jgi:hypothetical protein
MSDTETAAWNPVLELNPKADPIYGHKDLNLSLICAGDNLVKSPRV